MAGLVAGLAGSAAAQQFLAIEFRPGTGDSPNDIPTVRAAFEANDSALFAASDSDFVVIETARYAAFNGDGLGFGPLIPNDDPALDPTSTFTVTTTGTTGNGTAGSISWNDQLPLLEGYFFTRNDDTPRNLSISGFVAEQGQEITLTCYGVGDNVTQDARFTARYAGSTSTADTNFGSNQATETDSVRFVQFIFTANGVDDFIEFDWVRTNGTFAAFNAFSLSVADPTRGEVTAATLTTTDETLVFQGGNDIQLTALGTFSNETDPLNVTTLGTTVITYNATPAGIVEVGADGSVSPIGAGTATVTATVTGDNSSSVTTDPVEVTVEAPTNLFFSRVGSELADSALEDPLFLLTFGPTADADVSADATSAELFDTPAEGFPGLSYASSDVNVVAVDPATGVLTPTSPGTATITATLGGFSNSFTVTTEEPDSLNIETTPVGLVNFFPGGAGTALAVTVTTPNITTPINISDNATLTYSVAGAGDILVNENGILTPGTASFGAADITASFPLASSGTSLSDQLTVNLAEIPEKPLSICHRYSFNEPAGVADGLTVVDSEGGANGTVRGTGGVFDGDTLSIPGGESNSDGAYVDLPNGIISALPDAVTIEAYVTVNAADNFARIFDFGNNNSGEDGINRIQTNFFMLTPRAGNNPGNPSSELTESRTLFTNNGIGTDTPVTLGQRQHFVVTHDSEIGLRNIYLDGVLIGSGPSPFGASTLANFVVENEMGELVANDLNNWLGRSNATDPRLNGIYDDFRIWKGTMSPEQVAANAAGNPDVLLNPIVNSLGLGLCVVDFSGTTLQVDATGLTVGATYHFESLDVATGNFNAIDAPQFDAGGTIESVSIDVSSLGTSALIRLVLGPIPTS